jgi:hypothetical protein
VTKVIVAFLALGALGTYLFWPSKWPPPRESDRVWHPAGYSMIPPPGFEPQIEINSREAKDRLSFRPKVTGKWEPRVMITRRKDAPDITSLKADGGFHDGTFQNQPCIYSAGPEKKFWTFKVIVQRQGQWFDVVAAVPDYEDIPHSQWWAYMQSFQYDPSKAEKPVIPTTLPTTLPATFELRPTSQRS